MKLNEFAKDDKLDELIGTLAKGVGGLAKGIGKAAVATTAALDQSSGTSADIRQGGALRGGAKLGNPSAKDSNAQSQAERNKEIAANQKEMQDMIRAKEKEIQELRKQMSELQRQR